MSRSKHSKFLRMLVLAASSVALSACGGGGGDGGSGTETNYVVAVSSSPAQCGSVSGGGSYAAGAQVRVEAMAHAACSFLRWSEGGGEVSANASYAFSAAGDRTLVAEFAERITVISHSDGQAITGGNRAVTIAWNVTEAESVTLSHNGTPVTVTATGGSYSADLTLTNGANTLEITAESAAGGSTAKSLTLNYPVLAFADGQAASLAIGQPDLTSNGANQGGNAAANTLKSPFGNPVFHDGVLYVSDSGNHRVPGFNGIPTAPDATASFALGQDLLTTAALGNAANQVNGPMGVSTGDGRLFVSDYNNNRVLVWNTAPKSSVAADLVLGQADFGSGTAACAGNTFNGPQPPFVVGGKVIIADANNNRVLIWNTFPTSSVQAADVVLGQGDLTGCAPNRGLANAGADTFYGPYGVWSDGTKLFVSDFGNNRILVWNTFPTTNGQPADWALGHVDMGATAPGTSASSFFEPWQIHFSGNQFFVADSSNNRVLIWDSLPTSNTPADRVLGQVDFNSGAAAVGPARLARPSGITVDGNKLLVVEGGNNRVVVYEAP